MANLEGLLPRRNDAALRAGRPLSRCRDRLTDARNQLVDSEAYAESPRKAGRMR
jgi:hypothetical protein